MPKPIELCPNCASMRELDLSLGMMTINGPNGIEEVFLFQYHCTKCNTYVRSTTLDHQEIISPTAYKEVGTIPNYV
jgi:hypothetical protein